MLTRNQFPAPQSVGVGGGVSPQELRADIDKLAKAVDGLANIINAFFTRLNGPGALNLTQTAIQNCTLSDNTQASGTINGPIAVGGTWTAAAAWTVPAYTLGGTVTLNGQTFSGDAAFNADVTGITDLTTTGNTILGNAATDTLNVGNGGIIKDASGNTGFGVTPSFRMSVRAGTGVGNTVVAMFGNTAGAIALVDRSGTLNVQGYTNDSGAGSKDLTMQVSGGNLGIGVTPNAKCTVDGALSIKDGMTAPSATSGYAKLYVDTADGDLKVIFGDGTVKTISVDT